MSIELFFSVVYDEHIPIGKNIITRDSSILFEPSPFIDAFSIYPYHWSFELTTQKISETQYILRYALGSVCFLNCEFTKLAIPESTHGKVFATLTRPPCADGIYYNKYHTFLTKKYYDKKERIFAIGDIKATQCKCIEIAFGQFVLISNCGELVAVYIKIDRSDYLLD